MHAIRALDRARATGAAHVADADLELIVSTDGHDPPIVARTTGVRAALRGQVVMAPLATAAANPLSMPFATEPRG